MFYCSFVYIFYIFYINLPARLSPFCLCVVFRSGVASKHVRMPSLPAGWEEGLDDLDVWLDFNPKGSKGDRTSRDSSVCIKIRTPKATGVSYNACMHGPSRSYLGLKLVHLVHFLGQSFPLSSVSPHGGCVLQHLWTWCPSGTGWGCHHDSSHKMHRWCRNDVISSSAIDIPIISSISLAGFYLDIWSIWNHWNLYYFYFLNIWSIFNILIYLISFVFDVFDVFVYFIYVIYLWYLWIFISFVFFVVGLLHLMHLHIYCY